MPQAIREHLRYPEDMFRIQSDVYRLYHVTTGREFFNEVDPWQIARDPSNSARAALRAPVFDSEGNAYRPMLPYYLLMKLPGDQELSFIIMQPFTPLVSGPTCRRSSSPRAARLTTARSSTTSCRPSGPSRGQGQVGDFINQDTAISEQFTLLSTGGSELIQGQMLVVPVEESLLYVQPIYVAADTGGTAGVPELNRVIVSFDGQIEIRDTLAEALEAVFGEGTGPPPTTPPDQEPPDGEPPVTLNDVAALIEAAQQAFTDADAALRAGDLSRYAELVAEAQRLIDQASELLGDAAGGITG